MSFSVRQGIVGVVISSDGIIKFKYAERIKDKEALDNCYLSTIYAFNLSMRLVRQFIQDNDISREVTFELSNSTFIKWVERQYSKELYQDKFDESMHMLQSLPIRYCFSYSKKPRAIAFAEKKYCVGEKLGGLI